MNLKDRIRAYYANHKTDTHITAMSIAALIVVGSFLTLSQAVSSVVSVESNSGTRSAQATTVTDTSASGGSAVKFKAATTGTACASSTPKTIDGPDAFGGCYPGPSTTGVPAGKTLTAYTGPLTITTNGTIIDSKTVNGVLDIRAANVTITNTRINGFIILSDTAPAGSSFTITDSEVNVGASAGTGIGNSDFIATRVEVTGGNRSIACSYNCTVKDSYVHGQFTDNNGVYHESGIRVGAYSKLLHNSIQCDAPIVPPDGGCSADMTGYPDFAAVEFNLVDKNLLLAAPAAAFCMYGGDTAGKAYSGQTNHITITNNVFQKGPTGGCALYGPFTDFPYQDPGSVWTNNTMDDGEVLPSHW